MPTNEPIVLGTPTGCGYDGTAVVSQQDGIVDVITADDAVHVDLESMTPEVRAAFEAKYTLEACSWIPGHHHATLTPEAAV